MAEKIKTLLGIKKAKMKLSDYGNDVVIHFVWIFCEDALLALGACFGFYFLPSPIIAFLIEAIAIAQLISHILLVNRFRSGDIWYIEGVCEESNKSMKEIGLSVVNKKIYGRSNIRIKNNGKTYEIPVAHSSKIKEGNNVRVYTNESGVYQRDEDTYIIPNPIFVSLRKN